MNIELEGHIERPDESPLGLSTSRLEHIPRERTLNSPTVRGVIQTKQASSPTTNSDAFPVSQEICSKPATKQENGNNLTQVTSDCHEKPDVPAHACNTVCQISREKSQKEGQLNSPGLQHVGRHGWWVGNWDNR